MKTVYRVHPLILLFLAAGLLVWASCSKSNNSAAGSAASDDSASSLSTSSSISQAAYGDVYNQVMSTSESNNLNTAMPTFNKTASGETVTTMGIQPLGVTVTLSPDDTSTYPKTLTIDYGAGDTADGIIRTGELIVTLTGRLINTGTTVSVTFNQYTVAGYGLGGTYSFTNNSTQSGGLAFTTQISGGIVSYPNNGPFYTYSEADTLVQTAGLGTATFLDDVYNVTGQYSLGSSAGNNITAEITTPLVKDFSCGNFVSGVVSFTYDSIIRGALDYGTGTCDNQATLTIGHQSETVTLP
jgi:hypothetical protein